jgi:hypothetical protein
VAAREISEQLFQKPGDDAFLAGLLQDIGVLVLLGELRRPYADLLSEAIASQADLAELERGALGFDHRQLTAGLLQHWNLPLLLTSAIAAPHDVRYWAHNKAEHAHLVRVLHLAELFAQLIGQRRLSVLPDLLDAGEAYCNLDKSKLNEIIATLEPKVRQLASVLSLQFAGGEDYTQIIVQAHEQMSRVAESVAGPLSRGLANEAARPIEGDLDGAQAMQRLASPHLRRRLRLRHPKRRAGAALYTLGGRLTAARPAGWKRASPWKWDAAGRCDDRWDWRSLKCNRRSFSARSKRS